MSPNLKKRKASELDPLQDSEGEASSDRDIRPIKNKQRKRGVKRVDPCDTAPAPEHGYRVIVGSSPADEDHPSIMLFEEAGWQCNYTVQPSKWEDIKTYRNFILPSAKDDPFRVGEIVYVARHTTTPAPPEAPPKLDELSEESEDYQKELASYNKALLQYNKDNFWLAKILQIRADRPEKVLVLVTWLYWPYELPRGYNRIFFGESEVLASNLMDVIDASTVSDRAKVVYLDETDDDNLYEGVELAFQKQLAAARREQEKRGSKIQADDAPPILFWRQTFDSAAHIRNAKLKYDKTTSPLRTFCRCDQPNNPDKKMFQCANKACLEWNHDECLIDDIGTRAWKEIDQGGIDSWVRDKAVSDHHSSFAQRIGHGVMAVKNLVLHEVQHIAEQGIDAVKQETATDLHPVSATPTTKDGEKPLSHTEVTSSSKSRRRKESVAQTKPKGRVSDSWRSQLTVTIITDKDKLQDVPPFARIAEKYDEKRTWNVMLDCLACGETMD